MSSDDIQARIHRRRRSAGGGSHSFSGTAEGEPRNLNDAVADAVHTSSTASTDYDDPPPEIDPIFTPSSRMEDVKKRASSYEKEYRLRLLNRMLMRNVPIDEIAKELGLAVSTVMADRRELHRRLRDSARGMDINEFIGRGLSFYEEAKGIALRAASSAKAPLNVRLSAVRTAVSANNDQVRFMEATGVLDVLKFSAADKTGSSDLEKLVGLTEKFLEDSKEEFDLTKSGDPLSIVKDIIEDEDDFKLL